MASARCVPLLRAHCHLHFPPTTVTLISDGLHASSAALFSFHDTQAVTYKLYALLLSSPSLWVMKSLFCKLKICYHVPATSTLVLLKEDVHVYLCA